MSIAQYTAVFSLLGTNFGGNGVNTFMLPDLRSRAPLSFGQGPGLSNYAIGETGGRGGAVNLALYSASATPTTLAPAALTAATGGGQAHNNVQPYLALNFCIALQGIFPARS